MMPYEKLFTPMSLGRLRLPNRLIMAPLTRMRAGSGDVPQALNALYYTQRANAGLIISEATQVSRQGQGYLNTPGIYNDEQEAGWKQVVQAVHEAGGRIALQLWHVGRISHRSLQENGAAPVAPSAVPTVRAKVVALQNGTVAQVRCDEPRALRLDELPGIVEQYRQAARRARRAGFDAVEIHAANGYLLNQFLSTNTNIRSDAYGGSLENRARLVLEVIDGVVQEMGDAGRVGIRLSPNGVFNDIADTESEAMALYLLQAIEQRHLAYVHIAEPDWAGGAPLSQGFRQQLRAAYSGALIYCSGYDAEKAEKLLQSGLADAVAFGRLYIANPDLAHRFAHQATLNVPNEATFYGGGAAGYTDYPTWTAV
jgi:N-ethylmaleimide reductase